MVNEGITCTHINIKLLLVWGVCSNAVQEISQHCFFLLLFFIDLIIHTFYYEPQRQLDGGEKHRCFPVAEGLGSTFCETITTGRELPTIHM